VADLRIGSVRAIEVDGLDAALPVVAVRRRSGYQGRLATGFLKVLRDHMPGLAV
jgi:hypothetical protein